MNRTVEFFIHSNIYLSIGAPAIAYICMVLLQVPFRWEPLAISFSATFFLYNLNRWTDMEEDRINSPKRTTFVETSGKRIFYLSGLLYGISVLLALLNSVESFVITIVPLVMVFSYSVIRLKRLLILKNVIVAVGWGLIAFLVISYTGLPSTFAAYTNPVLLSVFAFVFIRVLIDTIAFDVLDMDGDKANRIRTIANTYGVKKVRKLCHLLNVLSLIFFLLVWNLLLPMSTVVSNLIIAWSFLYIFFITRSDPKDISDVIVDGEIIGLGLVVLLVMILL